MVDNKKELKKKGNIHDYIKDREAEIKEANITIEKAFNNYLSGYKINWIPMISIMIVVVLAVFIFSLLFQSTLLEKTPLLTNISIAIENNADIKIIMHIFNSAKEEAGFSIRAVFKKDKTSFYNVDAITLNNILMDIKSQYYVHSLTNSSDFILKINKLIEENNEINPFDKLESNQKYFFQNIRNKSKDNYLLIKEDVNFICEELSYRNKLVNKYLSNSKASLIISIIAIIIALFLPIYELIKTIRINYLIKRNLGEAKDKKTIINEKN